VRAPASITSSTGTGDNARTASKATAAMVLQAMMSIFTFFARRNWAICSANRATVSRDFTP